MAFATLRLPLLVALLLLSTAQLLLSLACSVLLTQRSHVVAGEVPVRGTNAALVLAAGAVSAAAWSVTSLIFRSRKRKSRLLQTRCELAHNFACAVVHLAGAVILSSTPPPAQHPTLPTLLPTSSLLSYVLSSLLLLLTLLTLILFIRRWSAFEDGVSKMDGGLLWKGGWWGGACEVYTPETKRALVRDAGAIVITLNESASEVDLPAFDEKDCKRKSVPAEADLTLVRL